MHESPSTQEILWIFGLEKLFSLRWSSSSWFLFDLICLWIATLEVVLPTRTWNMIINSKPYFVIIKIKINQILVSQLLYKSYIYIWHRLKIWILSMIFHQYIGYWAISKWNSTHIIKGEEYWQNRRNIGFEMINRPKNRAWSDMWSNRGSMPKYWRYIDDV